MRETKVELNGDHGKAETNSRTFHQFRDHKAETESATGMPLAWED